MSIAVLLIKIGVMTGIPGVLLAVISLYTNVSFANKLFFVGLMLTIIGIVCANAGRLSLILLL